MRKPSKDAIYLDNHATTPLDPRVLEAMMPFLTEAYGNAASRTHAFGWQAEEAVEKARAQVAAAIGARTKDIVFTSGATESDNLAIKGAVRFARAKHPEKTPHLITVVTEHHAVLDPCKALEASGQARVTYVRPDTGGLIDPQQIADALSEDTLLVSVMHANNEIGVIQDIAAVGKLARKASAYFHTDAAQSLGKLPLDVDSACVDLLSISAHKLYGPKGSGALFVRGRDPRVRLAAEMDGGGHERGMRSGTLNVAGIVGLGAACELAVEELEAESVRITALRARLLARLQGELDQVRVNGDLDRRLPGNLNLSFAHVEGESLLMGLKDVALSSGSACTSARLEPSYVLRAIGLDQEAAHASLRFGIGRFNTEEQIDRAAERVIAEVRRLRKLSPHYRPESPAAEVSTTP